MFETGDLNARTASLTPVVIPNETQNTNCDTTEHEQLAAQGQTVLFEFQRGVDGSESLTQDVGDEEDQDADRDGVEKGAEPRDWCLHATNQQSEGDGGSGDKTNNYGAAKGHVRAHF